MGGCTTIVALVLIVYCEREHEFFYETRNVFSSFVERRNVPIKMQRIILLRAEMFSIAEHLLPEADECSRVELQFGLLKIHCARRMSLTHPKRATRLMTLFFISDIKSVLNHRNLFVK